MLSQDAVKQALECVILIPVAQGGTMVPFCNFWAFYTGVYVFLYVKYCVSEIWKYNIYCLLVIGWSLHRVLLVLSQASPSPHLKCIKAYMSLQAVCFTVFYVCVCVFSLFIICTLLLFSYVLLWVSCIVFFRKILGGVSYPHAWHPLWVSPPCLNSQFQTSLVRFFSKLTYFSGQVITARWGAGLGGYALFQAVNAVFYVYVYCFGGGLI